MKFMLRLTRNVTVFGLACALASLALAQATLQITSPADGTVVHPGQSMTIRVAASGEPLSGVFIIGEAPVGINPVILTAAPFDFTVEIPKKINSGPYNITADGYIGTGHDVRKNTVTIDVERADSPVSLHAEDFSSLRVHVGRTRYSRIVGVFSDGTSADLQLSTLTTFRSDNIAVATVAPNGVITGVTPGSTKIIVVNGNARVDIPLTVLRNDEE